MEENIEFWHDGSIIRSPRLIAAFRAGLFTRRVVLPSKAVRYFARCTEPGCDGDYDFCSTTTQSFRHQKCAQHVPGRQLINGELVRVFDIQKYKQKITFERVPLKGSKTGAIKRVPIIHCATAGCPQTRMLYKNCPSPWLCARCKGDRMPSRPFEHGYKMLLSQARSRTDFYGNAMTCTLTYEQYHHICTTQLNCYYCDATLNRPERRHSWRGSGQGAYSLDRKNSRIGYTLENVVGCCTACNQTKTGLLHEHEMMFLGLVRRNKFSEAIAYAHANSKMIAAWYESLQNDGYFKNRKVYQPYTSAAGNNALKARMRPYEGIYRSWVLSLKYRPNAKNALPFHKFREICETQHHCFYCKTAVVRATYRRKGVSNASYLDRIDNRHPYHITNVVTACPICNLTRQRWISFEEMQLIGAIRSGNTGQIFSMLADFRAELELWACKVKVFTLEMMHFYLTGKAYGRKTQAKTGVA